MHWKNDALLTLLLAGLAVMPARAATLASPDGDIELEFWLTASGSPVYLVTYKGQLVLNESRLGLRRDDADFTAGLELLSLSGISRVSNEYELLPAKRRHNRYVAERRVAELRDADANRLQIEFQLSNDGVAIRYHFPEIDNAHYRITKEATSFHLADDARAWLQPLAPAKSGWNSTNPSYEELYLRDVEAGTVSPMGSDWVYPALFRSGETWLLISETGLTRNYSATRLSSEWRSAEYRVALPGPLERVHDGPVLPQHSLPWTTPWRFIVIGDLETVVESMLGNDLATPAAADAEVNEDWPGKASWSWPLLGDDDTIVATQLRFIDYAAGMNWRYTLVDSAWDRQIGYDGLRELVDYAATRNVRILLWFNSAGDWNTAPLTPRDRLLTRAGRRAEFKRIAEIGIAGVKVDFFAGDGQSVIEYYQDILEDAADFSLTVNFHGATLPRGWQRTYPNLMTAEAVRGLEFVTFEQRNADSDATHSAMQPFTRNVFDPMDFTPVVLDQIRNIERRTSSAFQLALSVLFTSGIQHYAEIPAGMAKAPEYVRDFLRQVPSIWDDIEFVDGFPGEYVVLARQGGGNWYLAGINATGEPRALTIDLGQFAATGATLISDGEEALGFSRRQLVGETLQIVMEPQGGFVAILSRKTRQD